MRRMLRNKLLASFDNTFIVHEGTRRKVTGGLMSLAEGLGIVSSPRARLVMTQPGPGDDEVFCFSFALALESFGMVALNLKLPKSLHKRCRSLFNDTKAALILL